MEGNLEVTPGCRGHQATGNDWRNSLSLISVQDSGHSLPVPLLTRAYKRMISRPPSLMLPYSCSACHGLQATPEFLQGCIVVVVHVIIRGAGILHAERRFRHEDHDTGTSVAMGGGGGCQRRLCEWRRNGRTATSP